MSTIRHYLFFGGASRFDRRRANFQVFSQITNKNTHLYRCQDYDDAVKKILDFVESL